MFWYVFPVGFFFGPRIWPRVFLSRALFGILLQEQGQKKLKAQDVLYARLQARGLVHIPAPGDGDCFFFHFIIAIAGLQTTLDNLKEDVCNYIGENMKFFKFCFPGGAIAVQRHVDHMRIPLTWATAFEITAVLYYCCVRYISLQIL